MKKVLLVSIIISSALVSKMPIIVVMAEFNPKAEKLLAKQALCEQRLNEARCTGSQKQIARYEKDLAHFTHRLGTLYRGCKGVPEEGANEENR